MQTRSGSGCRKATIRCGHHKGLCAVVQLRAALLAFNGLQTVAAAVQRRAACRAANSTAGDCSEAGSMITAVASLDAATANDTAIAQAAIKEARSNSFQKSRHLRNCIQ